MLVAYRGEVVLHRALGHSNRATGAPMRTDSVFYTFSLAKQLTNALVLKRIDAGEIAFTTQIREVIPEYGCKGKENTTLADLMLHRAGLPFQVPPLARQQLGDTRAMTAYAASLTPEAVPGTSVRYSAILGHSVLAEIVRKLDGGQRSYREILSEDLLKPLGMKDTSLGVRADLGARCVPVVARDDRPGMFDLAGLVGAAFLFDETFELPAAGAVSTVSDWFRFAEACRGAEGPDGDRMLSPAMLRYATANGTGTLTNSLWDYTVAMRGWPAFPAFLSPGFYLRGDGIFPHAFGQLASARTYGGIGAGSNCFWVDPISGVSYVFMSAGLMEESHSWERHQRYSDIVHSALAE